MRVIVEADPDESFVDALRLAESVLDHIEDYAKLGFPPEYVTTVLAREAHSASEGETVGMVAPA